jgi:hypothetical protein
MRRFLLIEMHFLNQEFECREGERRGEEGRAKA